MNRRNRNKSRSEHSKPTFKATAKAKAFSPRKTRLSKTDKKKLVETVKAEIAESSKSKPKEKKRGNKTTQNTMNLRLTEHGAGITEYISKHEGFSAIIKQRYSDFHVNEIDCDGNVVTLTTLEAPDAPVAAAAESKEEVDDYLKTTLPEEQYKKLMELIDSNGEEVEIEATDMSKEDRRKLHTAIVKSGKSRLISNTVDKSGKKYIVVKRSSKAGKQDRRQPWPAERGGEYVYFILHKENMDTVETVNLIASRLRVKPNMITYAGMKDRRAKTSQWMCVWKMEPQRLVNVSRSLRGIELGNYSFHQRPLRLGDLRGNRFRIALRNVTGSDKQIEEGLTSLKTKGFLNYYGLQRFGSSLAVPTYEIGKALLLGNWQKAVELILKPREGEPLRFLAEARKVWWETRDAAKAIKILRNKDKMIEGKLLLGLSRFGPKNYLNALDNIPRNTRLMYLHAYQSLIWNKVVSRRMQKFGLQPIVGDLVLQGEERAEPVELLEVGDHDSTATQPTSDATDDNVSNRQKPSVRVLSESELKDFTIYDVVLPLPGHDIVYPQNETKEWFEELLQADGLSPAKLKQSVRAYSVGGAYRRIAVRPTNVSWKIMRYSDPQTTLVLSDLEEMQKVPAPEDEKNGVYKALILDFCLPSSTYATMAVREVLKSDTSCYNQALLNDYHLPTDTNGTPKRRMSSAENGDSVSSSLSEDVKMEPQDQVTPTKHQVSHVCTRATKREKKTAESDGQMETESMPGGETAGTSTSKIEDKDAPSSEVTTKTTVVLSQCPLPLSKEIVPIDVDKNEQQLPTGSECDVALTPDSKDKSALDMEGAAVTIEDDVKCETNSTKAIPVTSSKICATQEQLPAVTCAVTDLQGSVELVTDPTVSLSAESVLPSEVLLKNDLSRSPEESTALKSEMTEGTELNEQHFDARTMSEATSSTKDPLLDKQNMSTGSPLTANSAFMDENTIARSLPSGDVETKSEKVTINEDEPNCNLEDNSSEPPDDSPCPIESTHHHEKVTSSASVCLQSHDTNENLFSDRTDPELLTQSENALPVSSGLTKTLDDTKTQKEELAPCADKVSDSTIPNILSAPKFEIETFKLNKETETPISEAELLQQEAECMETKEQSAVSIDNQFEISSSEAAIEPNKLTVTEISLERSSLTVDTGEMKATHSLAVTSEIDVAHTLDPLSSEHDCDDKIKVSKERCSERTEKSEVIKPTVTDELPVLKSENPVNSEISSNILCTSIQPSDEVTEGKVIENSENCSGQAVSPYSQSSPSKQLKPEIKFVSSLADISSCEKECTEKNDTYSSTSDTLNSENKNNLQHCVEHNVNSEADSERTEVAIKRKALDCENETEISPKKVKVEYSKSDPQSSFSDAQCSRSPESLKRKSANDDTETNDQESNTEKKKLKVEMSE